MFKKLVLNAMRDPEHVVKRRVCAALVLLSIQDSTHVNIFNKFFKDNKNNKNLSTSANTLE